MEAPLLPRESGQFIAERSKDVSVQQDGVQKVAEMLYNLRHTDHLNASGWKKANPLAHAATSEQVSAEYEYSFSIIEETGLRGFTVLVSFKICTRKP